jgi:hypothetical protein
MSRYLARRIFAAALILPVGIHALLAAREGLSNLFAHMAHLELAARPAAPVTPATVEDAATRSTRAVQHLETSLRHSPRNAWALEMMGTEQLRLARRHARSGDALSALNARTAARSASAHLHQALLVRPTTPFVWANLALSKLQLGEIDAELFQILRWADELGPWEPDVQNIVIEASLRAWTGLEPAQREAVVRTMWRGAQRDPGNIVKIAKSFNRLDLLCAINSEVSVLRSACGPGTINRQP